jgi:DNA-binding transcriptional ArsR family regulator
MKRALPGAAARRAVLELFRAFSHEDRLTVLLALSLNDALCVSDLTELCGATQSSMSHQLRHLRDAGLVRRTRRGKQIFYALDDQHVAAILVDAVTHAKEKRPPRRARG